MTNKNKIINQAQKFIQKGQWDKAIKELQKLVAEDPNDVRTLLKLGDVYAKKGERDQATKVYKQVAESYSEQGFFLKAVAVYKQILKHDPKHLDVTLKLAELYEHLGLTSEAMAQYQIASQIHDESGHSKDALDVLKRMVELDADNVASRIKLAESYSRENLVQEAIEEFQRAAEILKRQGRIDDYIKVAERLVYHDPNRVDVIKELAHRYIEKRDTKRALAKLQLCFKAQPKDIETLTLLANAFRDLGQVQKTIFVYRELARIHQENGNEPEARIVLQRILEVDPNDVEARTALGIARGPTTGAHAFQTNSGMMPQQQPYGAGTGPMPQFGPGSNPMQQQQFGVGSNPMPQQFGVQGTGPHHQYGQFGPTTGSQQTYQPHQFGAPTPIGQPVMPQPSFATITGQMPQYGAAPQHYAQPPFPGAQSMSPAPAMAYNAYPQGVPAAAQAPAPAPFAPRTPARAPSLAPRPSVQSSPPPREPFSRAPEQPGDEEIYADEIADEPVQPPARPQLQSPRREPPKDSNVAIGKILTETDVYIKYGLRDKALEHLRKIFEIDPDNVLAYTKMRDIYLSAGDSARAAETVANIVHIHSRTGDEDGLAEARAELERLAPGHPLIAGGGNWQFRPPMEEDVDSIDITEDSNEFDVPGELGRASDQDPLDAWLHDDPAAAAGDDASFAAALPEDESQQDERAFEEAQLSDEEFAANAAFAADEPPGLGDEGETLIPEDLAEMNTPPDAGGGEAAPRDPYPQYPAFATGGQFEDESSSVSVVDGDILGASSVDSAQEQFADPRGDGAQEGDDPFAGSFEAPEFDSEATDAGHSPERAQFIADRQRWLAESKDDEPPASPDTSDLAGAVGMEAGAVPELAEDDLPEATNSSVFALEDLGERTDAAMRPLRDPHSESPEVSANVADLASDLSVDLAPEDRGPIERTSVNVPVLGEDDEDEDDAGILARGARDDDGAEEDEADDDEISDELDEVEFLHQQGLIEEALEALAAVLEKRPAHPRALSIRSRFNSEELTDDGGEAAELDGGFLGGPSGSNGEMHAHHEPFDVSDDDLSAAFGGEAGGEPEENPEDHYDQGIAYKELNRLDDAIEHFLIAARAPSREIAALEMIGHCLIAKGDHGGAIGYFYSAIERGAEASAATNLMFEIGAAYEAAGDLAQAVEWFGRCYAEDPTHRDVGARISALGVDPDESTGQESAAPANGAYAAPHAETESSGPKSSKKNKISYI